MNKSFLSLLSLYSLFLTSLSSSISAYAIKRGYHAMRIKLLYRLCVYVENNSKQNNAPSGILVVAFK
jgi:hypothetical protein